MNLNNLHWAQVDNPKLRYLNIQDLIDYGYPVDFSKCQIHRKANLICKRINDQYSLNKQKTPCQCCGRIVGGESQKSICYQNNIFTKYGPGIVLYFKFFDYIIKLVLSYLLIFGIYSTVSNYTSSDCQKFKHCWSDTLSMRLSFLNSYQSAHATFIQLLLIILIVILHFFVFLFIRYKLKILKHILDDFLISPSDFSIILRQLPAGTNEQDINDTIKDFNKSLKQSQKVFTNNLKIHNLIFAYDLKQFASIKAENLKRFKQSCKNQTIFERIPEPQISKKLSTAIVIFQKQTSKQFFLGPLPFIQQLKRSHWLGHQPLSNIVKVKGQFVSVERAPEPDDIIWINQGTTNKQLLIRRTGVYFFSFVMLGISAAFQYRLAKWRIQFSLQDQAIQRLFSLCLACLITLINYLITLLLILSCSLQQPRTYTLTKISMTFKLVLMQFINSGVISIFISAIIYLPQFRYHKTLICQDMIDIMAINMVFNNIINFLFVRFQLTFIIERLLLFINPENYTQLQANKLFEASEVDIQYKYAYIFKTLWLTAFFMPAEPIVILYSIIALLINYWSQKYLFSGYYSIPHMLSGRISILVLDLLNYTSLWLTLGSFFIHILRLNFHISLMPFNFLISHIIGLVLSVLIIFLPFSNLVKIVFGEKSRLSESQLSYQIAEQSFQITYEGSNPAYKKCHRNQGKFDELGMRLISAFSSQQSVI